MGDVIVPTHVVLTEAVVGGDFRCLLAYLVVRSEDFDKIGEGLSVAAGEAESVDMDGSTVIVVPMSEEVALAIPIRGEYMDLVYETGNLIYVIVPRDGRVSEEECIRDLERIVDAINAAFRGEEVGLPSDLVLGVLGLYPG